MENTLQQQLETLTNDYSERSKEFLARAADLKSELFKLSIFRLIYFFVGIAIMVYLFTLSVLAMMIGGLVWLTIFGFLIRFYLKKQQQMNFEKARAQVNQWELDVLSENKQAYPNGGEFLDQLHPYALDLDLFGPYSFFQYSNRSKSSLGQQKYAHYLLKPGSIAEIKERQVASLELAKSLNWRQDFLAAGVNLSDNAEDLRLLGIWKKEKDYVRNQSWIPIIFFIMPIFVLTGSYISLSGVIPWIWIFAFLAVPILVLRKFVDRINETHRVTNKAGAILKNYGRLISEIEKAKFEAPLLVRLQDQFRSNDGFKASKDLGTLGYIISQLEVRNNAFAIILNIIGLWDLYWVYRLENWKGKNGELIDVWFESFAEFEALINVAGLVHNHTHWILPEVGKHGEFQAEGIAHPLLPRTKAIANDLSLPVSGHLKLLTGSNMSGKSTFLRTVGLNIVLALMGAPVFAKRMQLPLLGVYTSMRTQDALHESTSSFYAELKRLKMIIEAVEEHNISGEGNQPFFLLDEILKGTNSKDRHAGSRALIEQLISEKAAGIIATHDLELGVLEADAKGAIENLCIEVQVKGDELIFDYTVRKGVSQIMNATQLMRKMGIKSL